MPPHKCSYWRCENTSDKKSLFRFPSNDQNRLKTWISNCGNMTIAQYPADRLRNKYLCIEHFEKNNVRKDTGHRKRLLRTAVPVPFNVSQTLHCAHDQSQAPPGSDLIVLPPKKTYKRKMSIDESEDIKLRIKTPFTVPSKRPTSWSVPEDTLEEANNDNIESNNSQDDHKDQGNEVQDVPKANYCIDEDDHSMQDDLEKDLPFSWHKSDVIECDEESEPVLDGDVTAQELSLYEPNEPVPQKGSGLKGALGPSLGHSGLFSCDVCHETIGGPFRYSCVQCGDFDLCRACEANDHHADHFVLRVPAIKPEGEVRSLLRSIRQVLASAIAPSDDAIDLVKDEVKQEEEEEIEDVQQEMEQDVKQEPLGDPLEQPPPQHDQELNSPELECIEEDEDYSCNEQESQRLRERRTSSQEAPSPQRLAKSHSLFNQSPRTYGSPHSLPKLSSQYESRSLRVKPLPSMTNTPRLLNCEQALSNLISTPEDQTFRFQVGTDFRIPETDAQISTDSPMQRYCVVSSTSNVQQLVRIRVKKPLSKARSETRPKVMVVEEGQLIKVRSDTKPNIKDLRVVMERLRLPVVTLPFASD